MSQESEKPDKIAVVCLGNICRSPLAEGLLRARAEAAGLALRLDSVGIGRWHLGQPPDPRAVDVAARHGIDISGLRARQIDSHDYRRFDLLLCADRGIRSEVLRRRPADAGAEVALLLDWAGLAREGDVPDPYHGEERDFEEVFDLLARAADAIVARLIRAC